MVPPSNGALKLTPPPLSAAMIPHTFFLSSLECVRENSNHFTSVLLWSITPLLMAAFNALIYIGRKATLKQQWRGRAGGSNDDEHKLLVEQHTYIFLMLSYLVLPPVARKQFQVGESLFHTCMKCCDGCISNFLRSNSLTR